MQTLPGGASRSISRRSCAASSCGGGAPAGSRARRRDFRRRRSSSSTRAIDPHRRRDGVRRDAQVAALDDDPAADRRADHADLREIGRPRRPGRPVDADRSAAPAGGRVEPGSRARVARGERRPTRGSSSSGPTSCSRPAPSANRNWSRRRRRCGPPKPSLQSLQAQVQQQQVQLRYYTISAPTAGIVGDVPARVGMQVSTSTLLTTIDQNDTLEVYVSVPIERSGDLKTGLPIKVMSSDGKDTLAMTTVGFISPRVDESTQSILVKGTVRNPDGALRSSQFVRARIVWKTAHGLVVPVTAVARVNGQYFVFVAESADGKAKRQARRAPARDQGRADRRRRLSGARRHQGRRPGRHLRRAEARRRRAGRAGARRCTAARCRQTPAPPAPSSQPCSPAVPNVLWL